MPRFQESNFTTIAIDEIVSTAQKCKDNSLAFVQICAIVRQSSCELLYSYDDGKNEPDSICGFLVDVKDGEHVPSITSIYPAAFVFENETHDLFGIEIDDISIDFEGNFYTVAVAYPMNPRAAKTNEDANGKEQKDE